MTRRKSLRKVSSANLCRDSRRVVEIPDCEGERICVPLFLQSCYSLRIAKRALLLVVPTGVASVVPSGAVVFTDLLQPGARVRTYYSAANDMIFSR